MNVELTVATAAPARRGHISSALRSIVALVFSENPEPALQLTLIACSLGALALSAATLFF
jgi:hypothetical protein